MEYVFPNILPEQGMVVQSWLHIYPISQYITAVKILFLLDSELELELKDVKKRPQFRIRIWIQHRNYNSSSF